jgi:hypothetical protein
MRIGILTYHRAHNYGAVLQCYALKEVIKSFGHEVNVIDYRQPEIEKRYSFKSIFSKDRFHMFNIMYKIPYICLCVFRDLKRLYILHKKRIVFESFQKNHLDLSPIYNDVLGHYDTYVIGSDMLWADECMAGRFEDKYLGRFPHEKSKVVGYAISGTPKSFNKLFKQFSNEFLDNFSALSIREKILYNIVKDHTNRDVEQCIDPTLLTEKKLWEPLVEQSITEKPYLVTYYLRMPREVRNKLNEKVYEFATINNMAIVNIDVSENAEPITVEKFVTILANSSYTITDSFHGIIFSLIFNRPFNAVKLNDSHDARYVDILNTLHIQECLICYSDRLAIPEINYDEVNTRISDFRRSSLNFLKSNL